MRLLAIFSLLLVAQVALPHGAFAGSIASDDFNRPDGSLGPNWADMSDGGMAISSQAVTGTNASGNSGDMWTADTFTSDQYSAVQVTSAQMTGSQWIGPAVRAQNGGQNGYVGIYYWNNGSPQLMLFLRHGGNWSQLGSSYTTGGPLAAGTQLEVIAAGNAISFLENGVPRIAVSDSTLTGGAPGIMANGTPQADSWSGGNAALYSVGGTASGLSGTVVLQDNGGDDLSVSGDGTFTFATAVASGAPYNVTVKTNPGGQACTVTGGSGTVASANVTNVAVTCTAHTSATSASDDFNRPDGSLGPNWADMSDGGMAISSQAVTGTNASGNSGDMWTADTFTSDQYSAVQVTSAQMTGSQWIGPAVRAQNGGQNGYVGIYYWNNGSPQLMLFLRHGGNWSQLGSSYTTGGPLAAGTQLEVIAAGNAISFLENGVPRIAVSDSTLTGGAPGIMANGTPQADSWSGGNAALYSVGGTASGLSGTVVLQDNGGDDLSVSGDGTFTFATAVASGAPYNVTVKTNPGGQACTVTGGSGTVASANVTNVAVTCTAHTSATSASDDFNRPDGSLGPNWADMSDGGMAISSQAVTGTNASGNSGDMWTADTFTSDQYSAVQVTSAQMTGSQWIGPAVRAQNGGQNGYVGIYYWNNGSPQLMLFLRHGGNWSQLGSSYTTGGPLAAGTQLEVIAAGNAISFLENGVPRIAVSDSTLTGGAPGIMANGTPQADSWSGGNAALYSVGGTASGLSGTVVLQDNGGDDLSVSGDGTFTFATAVASGAPYNVTVKTNPGGQACTVTGGSGTVASANVTNVAVTCTAHTSATSASDDFNRPDGSLGPNWADMSDGGMAISSQAVTGTNASGNSGDMWTADTFTSDQYSAVQVTSAQMTGSQWIGPAVRAQNGGQNGYVGIYYWNNGSPQLMLFLRHGGNWSQLGSSYTTGGPLAAGTQLEVIAVGNTISLLENGVPRVGVSDSTLTGGAPGIMANGTPQANNWSGGNAGFQVNFQSTNSQGITTYNVISTNNGYGPQTLRVLTPTNPAVGVAHNFLIVLPVEPGLGNSFGDGLETLQALDAQDQYNLTIIEPTFEIDPWYANNPTDSHLQYETFMTQELLPWIKQNLATTGHEQTWLIGFSKSGYGAEDLILKHPDLFTLAAAWDFPADMSSYDELGSDPAANYGTDANFQANYRLTTAFVDSLKTPFLANNRIWIGGYSLFQSDMSDYDNLLTSEGIAHSTETPQDVAHRWDSGWVPMALAALYQDSINLHLYFSKAVGREPEALR